MNKTPEAASIMANDHTLYQIQETMIQTHEPIHGHGPSLVPSKATMKLVEDAVFRFGLIESGDRVAVGCSGGKDSLMMVSVLQALSLRKDLDFEMQVIHLDQQQPGFQQAQFEETLGRLGVHCEIITRDTWSVVEEQRKPGQIPCAICSRLRRGILNKWCAEHGFNKLALGHHLDDALETFMLNFLFGRRLDPLKASTPASELPVTTIRPLIFVEERKVQSWLDASGLKAIPCPVCDSFPDAKRRDLKGVLQSFGQTQPEIYASARDALYGDSSPFSHERLTTLRTEAD